MPLRARFSKIRNQTPCQILLCRIDLRRRSRGTSPRMWSASGQMVVHLDNGQVWEQVQEPTADMNLRAGDTVTIDKRSLLGSYWLGGRTDGRHEGEA